MSGPSESRLPRQPVTWCVAPGRTPSGCVRAHSGPQSRAWGWQAAMCCSGSTPGACRQAQQLGRLLPDQHDVCPEHDAHGAKHIHTQLLPTVNLRSCTHLAKLTALHMSQIQSRAGPPADPEPPPGGPVA